MGRDKNPRIAADTLSSPLAGKPTKDIGKAKPTKGAKPEIQPNISLVKQAAAPVIDAKAQKKREQHEANKAAQAPKKPKEVKEEENEMLKAAMEAHKRAKSQTHEVHQHFEKHDKTVLSAFAIFQKRETERLRAETPGLRPTQYKSKVQKLWIKNNKNKSSRNPKR